MTSLTVLIFQHISAELSKAIRNMFLVTCAFPAGYELLGCSSVPGPLTESLKGLSLFILFFFFLLVPLLLKIPLWKYSEAVWEQRKESCLFCLEPFGGGSHNTANTLLASLRLRKSIHNTLRCLKEGLVFVPEFSTL